MEQLILHALGDYVLQSDWMANEKTKKSFAAACHAFMYSLFFLLICSWQAWLVIMVTHFVIDRWRLAKYVVWAKNFMGSRKYWYPWSECSGTGYHQSRPPWMAVWLLIFADNTMHLICNYLAIRYL